MTPDEARRFRRGVLLATAVGASLYLAAGVLIGVLL